MTDKDLEEAIDATFFTPEAKEDETAESKQTLDLSNKGIAKLLVTGLAANGIRKATTSAMKTFGYAPEIYGKKGVPSIVTKVQIGVGSWYVSRLIIGKVSKMVDADIDKLADMYVEIRDSLKSDNL